MANPVLPRGRPQIDDICIIPESQDARSWQCPGQQILRPKHLVVGPCPRTVTCEAVHENNAAEQKSQILH